MNTVDLYTGAWYGPSNKQGHAAYHGPAAIALKRIVSRADPDLLPWTRFDDKYNRRLERGIAALQRKHDIPGTGQTGRPTFNLLMRLPRKGHPHELAADNVAINLLEDAWAILHPPVTPIQKVHNELGDFLAEMEAYGTIWHYLQRRPFSTLGRSPHRGGYSDCSEMVAAACYYVRLAVGIFTPDPNGRGYDGYGNSDTLYAVNRHRTVTNGSYEVGDVGVYGLAYRTRHVTMCRVPGSSASAIFTSNGSEAGPLPTRVRYRGDLLAVVRPRLVP